MEMILLIGFYVINLQ